MSFSPESPRTLAMLGTQTCTHASSLHAHSNASASEKSLVNACTCCSVASLVRTVKTRRLWYSDMHAVLPGEHEVL